MRKVLFIVFFILSFWGYHLVFSQNIQGMNCIYLDAGHGGYDGGKQIDIGNKSIIEKDLTLKLTLNIRDYFEGYGYKVLLTRSGDYDLSTNDNNRKREDIQNRVKLINNSPCSLYLSIHLNAYPNESLYGAQTFYQTQNEQNKILATTILDSIKETLNNTKRFSKEISGKYLIDHVKKTGCLIEAGFMTNPKELEKLQDKNYLNQLAFAIYLGTIRYLSENS